VATEKNNKAAMATEKKRTFLLVVLVLAVSLSIPTAFAYYYTIYPTCSTEPCITGQSMNWTVEIFNDGRHYLEYTSAEILDSKTEAIVAQWKIDFNPLSSERGDVVEVIPNHRVNITIPGIVPKQQYTNNLFYYYPCFTITVLDPLTLAKYGEYEDRHCYQQNESLFVLGCVTDSHCKADEFCAGNLCKPLKCSPCHYIFNHSCNAYECCADDDCSYNAQCLNHTCLPTVCMETQYLFNRTCYEIECEENEFLSNRSCVPLDCADDEGYANHTCYKLECADNEFISEHRCNTLKCAEDEYPQNHRCNKLQCSPEEGYRDHQCYELECYAFQSLVDHTCKNDAKLIAKLSAEVLIVSLILVFIVLDILKYRRHGRIAIKGRSLREEMRSFPSLEEELGSIAKKK
jgi:hypothetical protein